MVGTGVGGGTGAQECGCPSMGFPRVSSGWAAPSFPEAGPIDGRDFWLKGGLALCVIASLFSLFLQTASRGEGKLDHSLPDTQHKSSQCSMCVVCAGFAGDGRETKSEYNLKWKHTFYNFSF